jgi:glutamine cyclotransferase
MALATVISLVLLSRLPHDIGSFTQGLVVVGDYLYESNGLDHASNVRRLDKQSGVILKSESCPGVFAEGLTNHPIDHNSLVQLTWKNGVGFIRDIDTLAERSRWPIPEGREGWGITHDGVDFYMTDGSSQILRLDARTMAKKAAVTVMEGQRPIGNLNEIEWVRGEIWANIWYTDDIIRINPQTGQVIQRINLSHLKAEVNSKGGNPDVLNGIAWDDTAGVLYITGKLWPTIFTFSIQDASKLNNNLKKDL